MCCRAGLILSGHAKLNIGSQAELFRQFMLFQHREARA
ncbi:hypothetical protein FHR96_000794 [Halomonas organivorans]|uniref:Uncharacterized protein n=1 Tax=Halomonas organivorans TaxID=257772 RepID=A0A7W5BVK5_9GAMM|nr:hypothetical protein [Halomonas organivorans]